MTLTFRQQISSENPADKVNELDWQRISQELDEHGNAMLPGILRPKECDVLAAL